MKLPRRRFLRLAAGAVTLPAISRIARAQAYPARPIRLVIPFPPGGAYDFVGRPWAERMKHSLGTVVVENSGGGGGSWAPPLSRAPCPMAIRFCLAERCPTSTRPSSRESPCMIQSKTWTRSRVSRPISLHCCASSGPGSEPKGAHRLRSSQSGQALLRARGCGVDPAFGRRAVQIACGHTRDRAGGISRHGPADHRPNRRTHSDGRARRDWASVRIASVREDPGSCRDESHATDRCT